MTTKLKIDLSQGILEVEGSEIFVRAIYQDFKMQFLGEEAIEDEAKPAGRRRRTRQVKTTVKPSSQVEAAPEVVEKPQEVAPVSEPAPDSEKPSPASIHTYLKELDLAATESHPSLVEFMDSKFPITNEERNLVFIYYLQYTLKQKPITPDHVYTCYRKAKIRAPLDLQHSLQVTADHRKWIRIAKNGNITATATGKQYLEDQLPKKMKS